MKRSQADLPFLFAMALLTATTRPCGRTGVSIFPPDKLKGKESVYSPQWPSSPRADHFSSTTKRRFPSPDDGAACRYGVLTMNSSSGMAGAGPSGLCGEEVVIQ